MRKLLFVLSLIGQLGFIIALPAAMFSFGGAYFDRLFNTSPLFILLGLSLALAASCLWIYKFIKSIQ